LFGLGEYGGPWVGVALHQINERTWSDNVM